VFNIFFFFRACQTPAFFFFSEFARLQTLPIHFSASSFSSALQGGRHAHRHSRTRNANAPGTAVAQSFTPRSCICANRVRFCFCLCVECLIGKQKKCHGTGLPRSLGSPSVCVADGQAVATHRVQVKKTANGRRVQKEKRVCLILVSSTGEALAPTPKMREGARTQTHI